MTGENGSMSLLRVSIRVPIHNSNNRDPHLLVKCRREAGMIGIHLHVLHYIRDEVRTRLIWFQIMKI